MKLENLSYEEYRDIAQDGDVIFMRGSKHDIIQFLIMFATGSKHSHVAFSFWVTINERRRLMVVENQAGSKRRILNASYYKDRTIDVVRAPIPWVEICDDALSRVGEVRYGYVDALWVGIREFAARRGLRLPAINSRGEICSEFVARLIGIEPVAISPGTLYEKLKVLFPSR